MFPSIYYSPYAIHAPKYWLLRDKQPVRRAEEESDSAHAGIFFHIGQNDYFSNLATILKFYEESIYSKRVTPEMRSLQLKTIKNVIADLLYLEKYYIIAPKSADIERIHAKYL